MVSATVYGSAMDKLANRVLTLACLLTSGQAAAGDGSVRIVFAGDIMLDGGPGHIVTLGGDPFANLKFRQFRESRGRL
jgi:hypothetical protein